MSGVLKIEISESVETLKELLTQPKNAKAQQRVQVLYWLKTQQAETVKHLATLSGRHRVTISRWLSQYRRGGLRELLEVKISPGRKRAIPQQVEAKLQEELLDPQGFSSYKEIQVWLRAIYALEVGYTVVHKLVRYRLKAKLKVPRPVHAKQKEGVVKEFKKKLPQELEAIVKEREEEIKKYQGVRYWCSDESRMGLITLWARKLTGKGVQPIGIEQWCFDYFWLYGLVEPRTGESFFYEFCHLDSICFEKCLELFSQEFPQDFHIIQVDNGPLHQAWDLTIPSNVVLLFQPAYSPQVNPIERFWKALKKELKWELFDSLDELRASLKKILDNLTAEAIASLTGWQFIIDGLSVANI